jgi:hypothetical protein
MDKQIENDFLLTHFVVGVYAYSSYILHYSNPFGFWEAKAGDTIRSLPATCGLVTFKIYDRQWGFSRQYIRPELIRCDIANHAVTSNPDFQSRIDVDKFDLPRVTISMQNVLDNPEYAKMAFNDALLRDNVLNEQQTEKLLRIVLQESAKHKPPIVRLRLVSCLRDSCTKVTVELAKELMSKSKGIKGRTVNFRELVMQLHFKNVKELDNKEVEFLKWLAKTDKSLSVWSAVVGSLFSNNKYAACSDKVWIDSDETKARALLMQLKELKISTLYSYQDNVIDNAETIEITKRG